MPFAVDTPVTFTHPTLGPSTGMIVAVIPPGRRPLDVSRFNVGELSPTRRHASYVVRYEAPAKTKRGRAVVMGRRLRWLDEGELTVAEVQPSHPLAERTPCP